MAKTQTDIWQSLRVGFFWWFAIFGWELMSTPTASHTNSWQGSWLTLCLIPVSAYVLASSSTKSALFVYGCSCSFLFVPRFLGMDRFSLWVQYSAPPNAVIMLWWLGITLWLGVLCLTAAQLRRATSAIDTESTPPRLSSSAFIAIAAVLFIGLVAYDFVLSGQRQFLNHRVQWPGLALTGLRTFASAAALSCLLLFHWADRTVAHALFAKPSGALLLAIAAESFYRLAATAVLVVTTQPVTIMTVAYGHFALTTAGFLSAALVLLLHIRQYSSWRIPLLLVVASFVMAAFIGHFPNSAFKGIYVVTTAVAALAVFFVAYRDRLRSSISLAGVTAFLCLTIASIMSLVIMPLIVRYSIG